MRVNIVREDVMDSQNAASAKKSGTSWSRLFFILALAAGVLWFAGVFRPRPTIAVVTAGDTPYWDAVIAGAQEAARVYDVKLEIVRHKADLMDQSNAIQGLIDRKVSGIAVSPIHSESQAKLLTDAAGVTTLVTMDSDAAVSGRLCFVGTDNYQAGRILAEQIKSILPEGGEIILCEASLEKQNEQRRRQGLIDELLDRTDEPTRPTDPVDAPLKGEKFTIVRTVLDNFDREQLPVLAGQAIKDFPNVKCIVGLVGYSTPGILKALEQNGKLGQIKVVGFDANPETLNGIEKGHVHATILQDQFGYGFQAVRILAETARGDRSGLPLFQQRTLPVEVITKDRVEALRRQLAGEKSPATQPTGAM